MPNKSMRRFVPFILRTVSLMTIAGFMGLWLFVSPDGKMLLEQTMGETPESKLQAYVVAITSNDEGLALRLWELPTLTNAVQLDALTARRRSITTELRTLVVKPEYLVRSTEWWSTCCEPTVINHSRDAGGVRMRVQFVDSNGLPQDYVFDIFVRNIPYWGAALGYPLRQWVIRDIYPLGQQPLYWRYIAKTTIEYLK